jgi:hypothetical protein
MEENPLIKHEDADTYIFFEQPRESATPRVLLSSRRDFTL